MGLSKFSPYIVHIHHPERIQDTCGIKRIADLKFLVRPIIQLAELSQGEIISLIRIKDNYFDKIEEKTRSGFPYIPQYTWFNSGYTPAAQSKFLIW